MSRVAVILRISVALLFISCGYSSHVSAQVESRPQTGPTKIDEFGRLGHCDLTARLDNFVIQIQENAGAKGYVITYGPESEAGLGKRIPEQIKDYLINLRGLGADRFNNIYGGRNSDPPVLEEPVPENAEGESPTEPIEQKEAVDLTKLAAKWQLELAKTHLQAWIVPTGQPLPDPNEVEAEPELQEVPADPKAGPQSLPATQLPVKTTLRLARP
jgi:hypothetical protein